MSSFVIMANVSLIKLLPKGAAVSFYKLKLSTSKMLKMSSSIGFLKKNRSLSSELIQPVFTCLKSATERTEQFVKSVQG